MTREGTPAEVAAGAAEWSIVTGDGPAGLLALGRVDHVITDPPYDQAAHSKGRRIRCGSWSERKAGIFVGRPLDFEPMTEASRLATGQAVAAICARWALVFCQSESAVKWSEAMAPMRHARIGCWIKPDGQPQYSGDRPGVGWEAIQISHAAGCRTRWNGGGKTAVWVCNSQDPERKAQIAGKKQPGLHQTQKPLALMRELVSLFTDPGELIADLFCGSGTTVIAALSLGRRCVAWEERAEYADVARERVRAWCAGNTVSSARAGQVPLFPA